MNRRSQTIVVVFCLLSVCHHSWAADTQQRYSFKLDGIAIDPVVISLNPSQNKPQEGDLVLIDDILLTLGPEKTYDLKSTPKEDGRLLAMTENGPQVIGVKVSWTFKDEKKVILDPLSKLSVEEIRRLRGVVLDVWNDQIAARLKHVNPASTCLTITDNTAQGTERTLPPLPPTIQYLRIRERSNQGIEDYSGLSKLTSLSFLMVHSMTGPVDVESLRNSPALKYLDLRQTRIRNETAFTKLPQLRYMNLAFVNGVTSISFISDLPALAELNVQGTKVTDLSPLANHKCLVSVTANQTPIQNLPRTTVPSLRHLQAMSTKLSDEVVAEFARANPQCQMLFRWEHALREALSGVTRLRLRSGGTCHRDISQEKTLLEVKDKAKIAKLIENIGIDEQRSGSHCLCCGDPSFEFFNDNKLVLTLGFHHGQAVRWPETWPGDGALTDTSADFLCQWLADNGILDPLQQREHQKRRDAAAKRRMATYVALIPKDIVSKLQTAQSADEAGKAFVDGVADDVARAELCLKLFGCDQGSWNQDNGLDNLLKESLLPLIKPEHLVGVLTKATDTQTLNGAGRWLFSEGKWKSLDEKALKSVLPMVAKNALEHPRPHNRQETLKALGEIKSAEAKALLRSALAAEFKSRALPESEAVEPGGMVTFRPGDPDLRKASERVVAGMMLAKLGDHEILPILRMLMNSASDDDKKVLGKAISLLEENKK